jgi:hypothetical protein
MIQRRAVSHRRVMSVCKPFQEKIAMRKTQGKEAAKSAIENKYHRSTLHQPDQRALNKLETLSI